MTDSRDSLGDRMKEIESHESSRRFLPGLPVYARIDGRGFSKFTKGLERPFDIRMTNAMIATTKYLVEETHARIGYCQSDEISLVWEAENPKGGIFFDGKVMKMSSVLAGMATAAFTRAVLTGDDDFRAYVDRLPHFDARVMLMPSRIEASNAVLWRTLDAFRNSVSMAAHHYFSHKSLQMVGQAAMQERLFQEAGINFDHYPSFFKQGSFLQRRTFERTFTAEELSGIPEKHRPDPTTLVTRSEVQEINMPVFSRVTNRVEVIFNGIYPLVLSVSQPLKE
jgi:tRNA(His) guanylyltransferase